MKNVRSAVQYHQGGAAGFVLVIHAIIERENRSLLRDTVTCPSSKVVAATLQLRRDPIMRRRVICVVRNAVTTRLVRVIISTMKMLASAKTGKSMSDGCKMRSEKAKAFLIFLD
jgi:hypothetical protein